MNQINQVDLIENRLKEIRMPKLKKHLLEVYNENKHKFKNCPASTKFHHRWAGGLYDHTLEVIEFALKIYDIMDRNSYGFNRDDVIFVSFAHDLDKLDKYVKNFDKESKQEFIWNKNRFSTNDTAKVVKILSKFGLEVNEE